MNIKYVCQIREEILNLMSKLWDAEDEKFKRKTNIVNMKSIFSK